MDETQPLIIPAAMASGVVLAGRYRLEEMLGSGGAAEVFRATDELLQRQVAVKVFRVDNSPLDDGRRQQSEMRVLASLNHPALVTVFDAGREDGGPHAQRAFLVMELIHGMTLADQIAQGPLPAADTARIGMRVAQALAYVHDQNIVHRDVKPANVLIATLQAGDEPEFSAKLTDFGIARLVGDSRMTMHGMTVGTAQYLSPEQARGVDVGPAADVYSLGLVLLECLTGVVAFPGSAVESAGARLHRPPVIPSELGAEWVVLLTAMTELSPGARPTAGEVAERLRGLAFSATGNTGPSDTALSNAALSDTALSNAALSDTALSNAALSDSALSGGHPAAGTSTTAPIPIVEAGMAASATAQPSAAHRAAPAESEVRRLSGRLILILVVLGLAAIAIAIVLITRSGSGSGSSNTPAPSYPSVPGQLGTDLRQLQGSVQ
jgi:serine/threonine protein kinase